MAEGVTKTDLKSLLLSHEKRETKAQEDAESPEEQKLEEKAGVHEKSAFLSGFLAKRRADGHAEALRGFDDNVHYYSNMHPLPPKTVKLWKGAMTEKTHRDYEEGYNHFVDHFNDWIKTPEGGRWNAAQAEKHRRLTKKYALWRGFSNRSLQ